MQRNLVSKWGGMTMTHKYNLHSKSAEGSSDRTFGLVFAVFFLFLSLLPLGHGGELHIWAALIAIGILAVTIVVPQSLSPLNRLWTKLGLLLHSIVSPIALGIIFFALITPMAIAMRIAGKDPLRRRFDRDATSYWIQREPSDPAHDSMNNQF